MNVEQYGISKQRVEQVKEKLKNRMLKERIKTLLKDVTKSDLQNPDIVMRILSKACTILGIEIQKKEKDAIVSFIISQKIDPHNTFQLIKLWSMFR